MTLRPPNRSYSRPRNGWVIPFTSQPIARAMEMVPRLHSKLSDIGMTKTPTPFLAPVVTNMTKKQAPRTNQP